MNFYFFLFSDSGETRAAQLLRRRDLPAEVARRVPRGGLGVRQPERLVFRHHAHRHEARAVSALELRLHLKQRAVERENEARRRRLQRELINAEIRIHFALGFQHDQFLAEEQRHARAGEFDRRAE